MALQFMCKKVHFDSTSGRLQNEPGFVNFGGQVRTAECAVRGYNVKFTGRDRPIHEIEIDINSVAHLGSNVSYRVQLGLRDLTGFFDDPYSGFVEVLVIADVV